MISMASESRAGAEASPVRSAFRTMRFDLAISRFEIENLNIVQGDLIMLVIRYARNRLIQ